MKKIVSLLLAVCLLAAALPLSASAAELPFTDVPARIWYRDDLAYCYENGYIAGSGANTFSPAGQVTRSQFVTFLARVNVLEYLDMDDETDFSDVPPAAYYAKYVNWAANQGIVSGDGAGKFNPLATITREQAAVILANYLSYAGYELPQLANPAASFTDAGRISRWAAGAVDVMRRTGLLTGSPDGAFHPQDTMTRAEAAAVIARLARAIEDQRPSLFDYALTDDDGNWIAGFSIPESWKGRFICESVPQLFAFHARSSYESPKGYDGYLFSLVAWSGDSWKNYDGTTRLRGVSVNGQDYDLILIVPADVRYDASNPQLAQEYRAMAADLETILAGLWTADELREG